MKKITIYDIAKMCDCSPATVSLALNQNPRVSENTRKRVGEVCKTVNYQPSYFGKSLVTGKANSIGLVVPDVRNPLFLSMLDGVESQIKGTDYHLLLDVSRNDLGRELNSINALIEKKVDGLIISPLYEKELTAHILKNNVDVNRIVYLGVTSTPKSGIHFVETNSFNGAYKGVSYMLENGRKRIAFLFPTISKYQGIRRFNAYKQALADYDIEFDEDLVIRCDQKFENIYNLVTEKIKRYNPDGIFCLYDMAAVPTIRAAIDLGLTIPNDLSIVGYDNIELGQYIDHSLTTLETYQYRQGKLATHILLDLLAGRKRKENNVIEPSLIIRESS